MEDRMTQATMATLPELPLAAWQDTKTTLHLFAQIVGKVRMALYPKQNHWWHVTFYVSARGLTTGPMPAGDQLLEIEFDFVDHNLELRSSTGQIRAIRLYDGLTVAEFYEELMLCLEELGAEVAIVARPYDPERVGSAIPFAGDNEHSRYQAEYAERFWRILAWIDTVYHRFAGRFTGKASPVHLFWHSFDIAYARFSGREAPREGGTRADREAYSHEVIAVGFWAGDANMPAPSFYSYTYPEPEGLAEEPLAPEDAFWADLGASHMALLPYDAVRQAPDPEEALLSFLQSVYQAGASRAGWDLAALARKDATS
jgi:hypothetical protein